MYRYRMCAAVLFTGLIFGTLGCGDSADGGSGEENSPPEITSSVEIPDGEAWAIELSGGLSGTYSGTSTSVFTINDSLSVLGLGLGIADDEPALVFQLGASRGDTGAMWTDGSTLDYGDKTYAAGEVYGENGGAPVDEVGTAPGVKFETHNKERIKGTCSGTFAHLKTAKDGSTMKAGESVSFECAFDIER